MLEKLKKIFGSDEEDEYESEKFSFIKHLSGCEDEEGGFGEEPC